MIHTVSDGNTQLRILNAKPLYLCGLLLTEQVIFHIFVGELLSRRSDMDLQWNLEKNSHRTGRHLDGFAYV